KACLKNPDDLQALFNEAVKKAAAVPREPFKECWPYLQTMLRLIRAHHRGEYDQVPNDALLWIVAALNYLVDPFDLIPDKTPFLVLLVDATLFDFVPIKIGRRWTTSWSGKQQAPALRSNIPFFRPIAAPGFPKGGAILSDILRRVRR